MSTNAQASSSKPLRRSHFSRVLSAVQGFLYDLGEMVASGFIAFLRLILFFANRYIQEVNRFTEAPDLKAKRRRAFRFAPVRYGFRFFLYLFVPVLLLIVPVGLVGTLIGVAVLIDQTTKPDHTVDQRFVNIAKGVNDQPAEIKDIGATLMAATYLQMETELSSFLGWTVNDVFGLQFWDNRTNRQRGALHASRELLQVLSVAISKLGSIDEEDYRLIKARQQGYVEEPTSWMFPSAESRYWRAITWIKEYQSDLRAGKINKANINITNRDIELILDAIANGVMEVPHARLNSRNITVTWSQLDDRVFFAKGAAIVARDALVAIRYAFEDKIRAAGAIDNMDQAISSLEGAVKFHPLWILRGDADSMAPDHRAKISRYFTDARNRIRDVRDAIKR